MNTEKRAKNLKKFDYQEIEERYNGENASVEHEQSLRVDIVNDMLGDEITIALNTLQEEFREIIILCDLEDFKYEEIADILNIPIGTVRSRLHRARNAMKEKIKVYAKTLGYN